MDFDFMHPDGAPGQLHQMLGDAGFKSYLETQEAQIETNVLVAKAHAALDMARCSRIGAWTALLSAITVVLVLASLPVLVWLWEWVL